MAESKWNSRSPKANSYGTSAKPNAAAPPTKKPAKPSPEEEKRRDSLGAPFKPSFGLSGAVPQPDKASLPLGAPSLRVFCARVGFQGRVPLGFRSSVLLQRENVVLTATRLCHPLSIK